MPASQGVVLARDGVVEAGVPVLSALDRGLLYGDGVFTTLRVHGGRPVALSAHLARLRDSAARLTLPLPWDDDSLRAAVTRAIAASGLSEAVLRLIVTRGVGAFGLDPGSARDPELLVTALPLPLGLERLRAQGVTAVVVGARRTAIGGVDPRAKVLGNLAAVLATAEARRRGADEAIMLNDRGEIAETAGANLFAYVGGTWCTPPLEAGILAGVTRARLLVACAETRTPVAERTLTVAELRSASAIVLTSSIRELVPVCRLDDVTLPLGEVVFALQRCWAASSAVDA